MPHQNVQSGTATAQNAATDPRQPNDRAVEEHAAVRPAPDAYAAPDVRDATVAPPAAGEMADYMDEGDALDGDEFHTGRTRTNVAAHSRNVDQQGPKTVQANRQRLKGQG
jgi:hypothetical protein